MGVCVCVFVCVRACVVARTYLFVLCSVNRRKKIHLRKAAGQNTFGTMGPCNATIILRINGAYPLKHTRAFDVRCAS